MAVRKLRRSWWVDFRWRGSRIRKRSPLNSADGARQYEVILRRSLMEHGTVDKVPSTRASVTLAEFVERWLRDYVDVNNGVWERYKKRGVLRRNIVPVLGSRTLRDLTIHDVESVKGALVARGVGAKTVNNTLAILRKCLVTAHEWEELDAVPRFRMLPAPAPQFRFLEPPELARLLDACDPWLRTLVVTAARTGLRWSELAAVEWRDVDLDRRLLTVARAVARGTVKAPKNGRVRHVPLTSDVVAALRALPRSSRLVFHSGGAHLRYNSARMWLRRTCQAAGVQPVSWHVLRHTYATHLSSAGAPIKAVQELLGHSSLTMTMRYAHVGETGLRAAVALLEPGQQAVNVALPEPRSNEKSALSSALPWSG